VFLGLLEMFKFCVLSGPWRVILLWDGTLVVKESKTWVELMGVIIGVEIMAPAETRASWRCLS